MRITRTANAGVLLEMDGVSILLDGVCEDAAPYLGTPAWLRQRLLMFPPDALAFTHGHTDHFDPAFALEFQKRTLRPILGPESLAVQGVTARPLRVGDIAVTPVPSRHIGKVGNGMAHVSFLLEGSRRVFFTGDASPLNWDVPGAGSMPKADILLANYAYATSEAGWQRVLSSGAATVVLLHLPEEARDAYGLWQAVRTQIDTAPVGLVRIPALGETLILEDEG